MNKKHDVNICDDPIEPDQELLVWEKWITIRKEETEHLSNKTGRPPAELVMNLLENVREKKEEKLVLEHAQIEKKAKVRGSIWEQPQRLKQRCYYEPVYEVQRTCAELGRPRIIEHIGVPQYIQETEKGKSGVPQRKPCSKLDSKYLGYKDKREKELETRIKKIDPFRSEIKELMIKGNKPKAPPKKLPPLPTISITSNHDTVEECLVSVYAIRINNTIILKEIPSQNLEHFIKMQKEACHKKCDSWSYYFNCPVNRVGRSKLSLHNIGTVKLRYGWKKIKRNSIEDVQDQVFFFNKNENVIFPGQHQDIFFTFISNEPGAYCESWEMIFYNICFFDSLEKQLIINLNADSVEDVRKIKKKTEKLENVIYKNVLKTIARDLIDEIVVKATSLKPPIYPYKKLLLEAEMFVMKNPVCYYHQTEVMKMKDLYVEMTSGEDWDLSITTWRETMMEKEFDERMKYYELLRSSHRECLKPWFEENNLFKQKYNAVSQLLGQMADKFDEEYIRIPEMLAIYNPDKDDEQVEKESSLQLYSTITPGVRNLFYLKAYDHLATTIEECAGLLSSLDLNRWIRFDFCRT